MQLITEAKKICPDVVIVLGEDLTRFRNASKQLYALLRSFSWNSRCERLGFDEVWLDVSDLVDSNVSTLNSSNLSDSFFRLSKHDPTVGFSFDATNYAGHVHPELPKQTSGKPATWLQGCMTHMLVLLEYPGNLKRGKEAGVSSHASYAVHGSMPRTLMHEDHSFSPRFMFQHHLHAPHLTHRSR